MKKIKHHIGMNKDHKLIVLKFLLRII